MDETWALLKFQEMFAVRDVPRLRFEVFGMREVFEVPGSDMAPIQRWKRSFFSI